VAEAARAETGLQVEIAVNAADQIRPGSVYLTVTGLSAEAGDDGQVGRGNRVNGLITPYRPMSLEAAAGKNPVAHVGKLYNIMATRIAHAVVREAPRVREAYCYLLSQIGSAILEPQVFEVAVRTDEGHISAPIASRVREVAHSQLQGITVLWREAIEGALRVW
jgi:S-adenosylmethionine synthetase